MIKIKLKNSFLILILLFLLAQINIFAQFDDSQNLSSKKFVKLHKNYSNSPTVLAGIANIRFKGNEKSNSKNKTAFFSVQNPDFTIIDDYLTTKNAVSSQKERFGKYSEIQQKKIKDLEDKLFRTFIIQFDENENVLDFCEKICKKYPNIECAEPYYVAEPQAIPNDPQAQNQTVLQTIKAFEAWDFCEGNENVLIGISDSGINWEHEDLRDAIAINQSENQEPDGIDSDENGYIDDYYGYNFAWQEDGGKQYCGEVFNTIQHGTNVAGIIGARTNNGIGIAGIGNKCKIVPIKIVENSNNGGYLYGYQSIIYATVRGCKVLNCSWGTNSSYSVVNQSIIDYALVCDVAIVAAAGNLGANNNPYGTFFPAAYFGVLGVGQVLSNDNVDLSSSVVGPATRLMAQGYGNYTVTGSNQYIQVNSGSSYSAPVVSGIVGILRSYKPELSPLEAVEIVRISGENIRDKNNENRFIPIRVNMLNSLLLDDSKMPSIILKEKYFENTKNEIQEKFQAGDTAILVLNLINVLADAKNISIKLTELSIFDNSAYKFLDTNTVIPELKKNETYPLKFRILVNNPSSIRSNFYLVEMNSQIDENLNYVDDFKFQLILSDNLTTLKNDKLTISVSDKGTLGYDALVNNHRQGVGFEHLELGDFLYEAGIVAVSDFSNPKAVSTNLDANTANYNSFEIVKRLNLDENENIITDSKADNSNKIGINVSIKYEFPSSSSSSLRMILKAKNISGANIKDFAFGQYYDWDVNNSALNTVSYFKDLIDSLDKNFAAAEIASDQNSSVFIGSLVCFDDKKYPQTFVIPQAAGIAGNKSKQTQIQALTSGINKQINGFDDISYFVGMFYQDDLEPNEEIECIICTGIEKTKELLANSLLNCWKNRQNNISQTTKTENNFFLNKNNSILEVVFNDLDLIGSEIEIYNLLGTKLATVKTNETITLLDFTGYSKGIYFIRLIANAKFYKNKNSSLLFKSFVWD